MRRTGRHRRRGRLAPIWLVLSVALGIVLPPGAALAQGEASAPYTVTVAPTDPPDLQEAIEQASILIGLADEPAPSPAGLANRIEADRRDLETLLRGLGHYAGTVEIVADAPPDGAADSGAIPITIVANPGPTYPIGTVDILREEGGTLELPGVTRETLGLAEGTTATSSVILEAERRIVRQLRADGLPFADVPVRQVWVDHAAQRVDVAFAVAPGPAAPYGTVSIEGAERVSRDLIAEQAPFRPGERFDPDDLATYRSRLANLGPFQSVRIETADEPAADGTVPIEVTVAERKPRFVGARADFSTSEGLGAGVFWGHRNLFGGAERLRLDAAVGRLIQNELSEIEAELGAELRVPAFLSPRQSLIVETEAVRERPEAFERISLRGAVGIERELTEALLGRIGFEVEQVQVFEDSLRQDDRSFTLVSLPLGLSYDTRDDILNPTQGVSLNARVVPYVSALGGSVAYTRTRLDGSTYYDLLGDGGTVLAGRLALGAGFGDETEDLPPNLRFYAGGGGSVRGYGVQRVGPLDGDDPQGGRSLFETSFEIRQRVFGDFAIVPFIDAGMVTDDSFPGGGDLQIGGGLGARYLTPLGPLRVDFAVPFDRRGDDDPFQVYIAIGQAF